MCAGGPGRHSCAAQTSFCEASQCGRLGPHDAARGAAPTWDVRQSGPDCSLRCSGVSDGPSGRAAPRCRHRRQTSLCDFTSRAASQHGGGNCNCSPSAAAAARPKPRLLRRGSCAGGESALCNAESMADSAEWGVQCSAGGVRSGVQCGCGAEWGAECGAGAERSALRVRSGVRCGCWPVQ